MKNNRATIEQRIQNMKQIYSKTGELIDKLPNTIPYDAKEKIKSIILKDKDLQQLMEGIDSHRPPRFFLIGRTGVGKSSLINALCGAYVARVNDVQSCTKEASVYTCKNGDSVLMEICDSRGFAESESIDESLSAEEKLIKQVSNFSPDVAILMLNCTHRDGVDEDARFLSKLAEKYQGINKTKLPIIVVVNKCDEMAPARLKDPSEYTKEKINKIDQAILYYKDIIQNAGLEIDNIIGVSSLIDWMTSDGKEIGNEEIEELSEADVESLEIAFDGRYHITELLDILEKAILDFEAQMGLRMAARLTEVVKRLANHLITIFSGIAGVVALTPIPVSDIYILLVLQGVLVCLISALSGREITLDAAKEFILSLGNITGAGYAFRLAAQQATKLINVIFPGAGSVISSGIASFGTSIIGKAAIAYYIDGQTYDEVIKKAKEERQKKNSMSLNESQSVDICT